MTGNPPSVARIVATFGGQTALAKALGCSQGTVWGWLEAGRVPSSRIPEIIEAGRRLPEPVALEPNDFFDIPAARASEAAA